MFDKHRVNADILVLQETHSVPEVESMWENEWGGKALYAHGTNKSRGIALFVTKEMRNKMSNIVRDVEGRYILVDIYDQNQYITLVAIYAPNEDCPNFFETLARYLRKRSEHKLIIGDFNLTLNVELDRLNTNCNNNKSLEQVENLMDEFQLRDVWRIMYGDKREYSWIKRNSNPKKASRIDFALVSAGLDQKVEQIMYLSSVCTDHRGLYMFIELTNFERGRGYWKFNTTMLQKQDFLYVMNEELEKTLELTIRCTAIERWELLKKRIKKCSLKYARSQADENRIIISQLTEKVNDYESRLPLIEEENRLLEDTKSELEEKTFERIQGVMFRSKAKWYEEGEKSSQYFFLLEKAKYNAKTCYKLITEEGKQITDQNELMEEQRNYYEKLYAKDEGVHFNLENHHGVKVPISIQVNQDDQLTVENLGKAVSKMNNNKTPGQDGIPVDFYKVFWHKLKQPFFQMVLECFQQKKLHTTARQGILNLIPKPNKDSRLIKNLRPITLLNTDYKIIEKAIADKMLPALDHIIHTDQRGFMKNRRISVNIRKMLDIIHQADKEDLEAVVLSLDFVKCFDKCSFSILHGSLEYFEFGSVARKWTEILYNDFIVNIQSNGHFSKEIKIQKGVHQGGCCSSLYFLVIAEILALSLRKNENIEGITLKQIRNLLNQFADDMDIFSRCTEKSIKAIFKELDDFKNQSGFTVSYDKTTLYRIGSLRHSNAQMYDISQVKWSNEDITVLGVTITHEDLISKNYDTLIEKTRKVLFAWYNRGLSLMGKVQVVNTLIASLYVYKMMVLPSIPDRYSKTIDNIIREFLWSGKKAKIAYHILQLPKSEGGLGLVSLKVKDKALKTTWPQILCGEREYAEMVYAMLRCSDLAENLWRCSISPEDVEKLKFTNTFWRDVLKAWAEYNYYGEVRIENQIVWWNSKIKIKGKMIMWKNAIRLGLLYVHQLFDEQNFKSQDRVYQEYGLSMMQYNSLKSTIPAEWRTFFSLNPKSAYFPLPPHKYDQCLNQVNFSKSVYKLLSGDIMSVHSKYIKWRIDLQQDFCEGILDFRRMITSIYSVSNVAKFRSFQYRLVMRGIVTNVQLERWG